MIARKLFTEIDAARFLALSPATLRRWRWARVGPPYVKVGRKAVRYAAADLAAFVAAGARRSTGKRCAAAITDRERGR